LADAESDDIFVPVDLSAYRREINNGNLSVAPPLMNGEKSRRASIETLFHAVFPHKVVVHSHLIDTLYYLVKRNAQALLQVVSATGLRWDMVEYAKPGVDLGEKILHAVDGRILDVLFLANHGVIVGGESVSEIQMKYGLLRQSLAVNLPSLPEAAPEPSPDMIRLGYELLPSKSYHLLGTASEYFDRLGSHWAMYPDHVVFLGAQAQSCETIDAAISAIQEGRFSDYVIVRGVGVFTRSSIERNKLEMLEFYTRMLAMTMSETNIRILEQGEIGALLNWDAEKYRQAMAK
jgi:rhamnose utilization protein RhaD (predicted bifunctional aldolase and dehydrogenase)